MKSSQNSDEATPIPSIRYLYEPLIMNSFFLSVQHSRQIMYKNNWIDCIIFTVFIFGSQVLLNDMCLLYDTKQRPFTSMFSSSSGISSIFYFYRLADVTCICHRSVYQHTLMKGINLPDDCPSIHTQI